MALKIDRVIQKTADAETMNLVWDSCSTRDNWANLEYILSNNLEDLLTSEELVAIQQGCVDYIAFRLAD